MKTIKLNFFSLLLLAFCLGACSDDGDEAQPDLSEVNFLLFEDGEVVTVPDAMIASNDQHAQEASIQVAQLNYISIYSSFFNIPVGASNSEPIKAANGRMNANVSTYVYGSQDGQVAYQVTERSDSYFFEIFLKSGNEPYYKFMEGEQKKDKSEATFILLDPDLDTRKVILTYTFHLTADGYNIQYHVPEDDVLINLDSNNDLSGHLTVMKNSNLEVEYEWDALGNGSWKVYDESGNLTDQGTWTV